MGCHFFSTHALVPERLGAGVKVLVARFDDVPAEKYSAIAAKIRENGTVCASYIGSRKFGKQIDYAVKENYTHVVIMGGSELEANTFKIKNLSTHEESTHSLDELSNAAIFN